MTVPVEDWICEVERWIGTPVRHRGTGVAGVDCSGLLIGAARTFGVEVERGFLNGSIPSGEDVTRAVAAYASELPALAAGCVVQMFLGREPRHLGVYVGSGQLVHAKGRRKRVVRTLLPSRYHRLWWPNWLDERKTEET